jgi:uncharacterized protein (TIGR02145 family)
MNKKNAIWIYALVMTGSLLVTASSCKKNDDDNIVKDKDGNVYHPVKIGTQVWMQENLKTTKFNDGTDIPPVTDSAEWVYLTAPGYCWYDNDEARYKNTYGAIYNWYTVNTGKLCPTGWHLPADDEWTALGEYLIANGYNYDSTTTANGYAKAIASDTGWFSINYIDCAVGSSDYPDKINATGFTALPGGIRNNKGEFERIGLYGMWWSSSERDTSLAWYRTLAYDHCGLVRSWTLKENGFSIRCLKD